MTSEAYFWLAGYLFGAAAFARFFVWWVANTWSQLRWDADDTVTCLLFSVLWPVMIWFLIFGLIAQRLPRPPIKGIFWRWHQYDVARTKARKGETGTGSIEDAGRISS